MPILQIYRRKVDTAGFDLREQVYMAVEAEIQAEVSQYELSDEEYLDIADR